jgi:dTDP-4-dehydrorhamnose reductase
MCRLAAAGAPVRVVTAHTGSPTWSRDLAAGLVELGANANVAPGIYHATNAGEVTWYGLARAVFAGVGADPKRVEPTTSAEFPRPAPRPSYSVLSNARWAAAGLAPLRPWPNALAEFLLAMR